MTPACVKLAGDEPCNGYQIIRAHLDVEREIQKNLIVERDKWFNEALRLKKTLDGIAEYCAADHGTMGAIARLAAIRKTADQALR